MGIRQFFLYFKNLSLDWLCFDVHRDLYAA